jgi:hypothetical protein
MSNLTKTKKRMTMTMMTKRKMARQASWQLVARATSTGDDGRMDAGMAAGPAARRNYLPHPPPA